MTRNKNNKKATIPNHGLDINGTKIFMQNGKLHRLDGPAIIRKNGDKEYWIQGVKLTESEFKDIIKVEDYTV